jgi:hypothetical protein
MNQTPTRRLAVASAEAYGRYFFVAYFACGICFWWSLPVRRC